MNSNKSKINYYDSDKEKVKNNNFTKLTRTGISLIVLVITIIVIIILAAAIIISLNNNNPIMEANTARYESDRANMQAVFTNAVAKVMAKNQATVSVSAGQINTITGGVSEIDGQVAYTLTDAQNESNATGTIVFDKGPNTDTVFYTGKKLPIYAAGDTKWYVDSEGNISLEVAGTKYGSGEIVKPGEVTLISGPDFKEWIYDTDITSVKFLKSAAPTGVETYDISEAQDGSILTWLEDDTTMCIAPKNAGDIICANPDSSYMFNCGSSDGENYDFYANVVNIDFENFNTSKVTSMSCMFKGIGMMSNLTLTGIENWDVSNVTDMSQMFKYACNQTDFIYDFSNWKTDNVIDMSQMFVGIGASGSQTIKILGLNNWNVSKVKNMSSMFSEFARGASEFYIDDLSTWDTSSVENMSSMFSYMTTYSYDSIFKLNLSNWKTQNVIYMNGMFLNAGEYASEWSIGDISNWDTSSVTNMNSMFERAGKEADYTLDLSRWNVSKIESHKNFDKSVEDKIISPWD